MLGNVHTYDIMTLALIWLFYLVLQWTNWPHHFQNVLFFLVIISALIAFPSVAYQFWVAAIDPVFRARVNTPIFIAFCFVFLFQDTDQFFWGAVACVVYILVRYFKNSSHSQKRQNIPGLLLITWSIAGLIAPYIPIAQQRKLIMGYHIPLCLLAAYGASLALRRMPRTVGILILSALILLSVGSNIQFLARDIIYLRQNRTVTHYRPYLSDDEIQAMNWIKGNTPRESIIYAPPEIALFMPSYTGRSVYYGHWSETPNYSKKNWRMDRLFQLLAKMDLSEMIYYQKQMRIILLHTRQLMLMY